MEQPSVADFGSGQEDQFFRNPYIDFKNRIHAHFSDRYVIDPEGTVDEIRRYVARQQHGFPLYWDADLTVILCEAYLLAGRPKQAMAAALRAERLGRQIDISPGVSPSLSEPHRKSCEKMKERCATLVEELQYLVENYPWAFGPGAKNEAAGENRAGGENRAEGENKAEGQNQDSSVAPQSDGDEAIGSNTAASADTSGPSRDSKKIDKRVDLSDFNENDEDKDTTSQSSIRSEMLDMKGLPSNRSEVLTLARTRPRDLVLWLSQFDASSNRDKIQALEDAFPDETGRLEGQEVDVLARYLDRIYIVASCKESLSWTFQIIGKPQHVIREK